MNDATSDLPVTVIAHPIIDARLTVIRDRLTGPAAFREALHDIGQLMVVEATRDLETEPIEVTTPIKITGGYRLKHPVVLVPILRAGVGMAHGFGSVLHDAAIGYIGLSRDETTFEPRSYYCNLPPGIADADVFLIDPMLATGNSGAEAATQLKQAGAHRIRFVSLIAAPYGIRTFARQHPDIPIFTAAIDEGLNDRAYIVPGLGDAGDRYFGTF